MTEGRAVHENEGETLPRSHGSLARGVAAAAPGTVHALTVHGGIVLGPREGRTMLFGRNRPDVHVCLGEDDPGVSRQQGDLTHVSGRWWVTNKGRMPIRVTSDRLLFKDEEPVPLSDGYTPLFVRGSGQREHLLELFVTGDGMSMPPSSPGDVTRPPRVWALTDEERIALIVLGQRYLLHDPRPQPLTWKETAAQLDQLQPEAGWRAKRVEHLVINVRTRLSRNGVAFLTREEVGEPVGNALNDNLIQELLHSTTLVPPDLSVLG